jgi:hypothetical protein
VAFQAADLDEDILSLDERTVRAEPEFVCPLITALLVLEDLGNARRTVAIPGHAICFGSHSF